MMPDGEQADIDKSYEVVQHLGIRSMEVNIGGAANSIICSIARGTARNPDFQDYHRPSDQTLTNLPPRIRMATLYAISQSLNGRVSNNCNLSEEWVGYSTRWGDSVGDFAPLVNLTASQVKAIGYELDLPAEFIEKVPSDGLCGKTDEDNLGFTYEVLDRYIETGVCEDAEVKTRIDYLHEKNRFKRCAIPCFHLDQYDL
jgi:NAD+ synthase